LINAHKRGCKTKAFLDMSGDIEDVTEDIIGDIEAFKKEKNAAAYSALKEAGVEVIACYNNTLNSKTVIIDEEIVLTGSVNWSEGGLSLNRESNTLIKSEDYAESLLEDLQELKSQISSE